MEDVKPWYVSRTIWASIVMVAATVSAVLGFPVEDADAAALIDTIMQGVAATAGIAAIVGRLAARSRIG